MTTRRDFIKQSSVLTTGLFIPHSDWAKFKKKIGIQLYTLRNELKDLPNVIAKIAEAGYDQVELFGYNNRKFFGRTVQEMSALLKQHKLTTPSGHYGLPDFLYNADYNWDSWKYLIEDAKTLGHKYLVVPYLDDKHRTTDDYKRVAERLNIGGEMAKKAGMCSGYHNHQFEFDNLNGQTGMDILLNNTNKKLVHFELDLYWVRYADQDPIAWFKKYPGRFPMWHMKDMAKDGKPKGQTCEVGSGVIDFKTIYNNRKLAGLEYAYVEQEQYTRSVFESIKMSHDYISKNIIA